MIKYRFLLVNDADCVLSVSETYTEEYATPNLNQNLARWISYGFPGSEGEDQGAGIIVVGDRISVEFC